MRALRRLRRQRRELPEVPPDPVPDGPKMCARGEHELTPETTFVDRQQREHCRLCWREYGPDLATG